MYRIRPLKAAVRREMTVPGDKSVTHRAIMFNAVATGAARIEGALLAADTLSTAQCMRGLGAEINIADGVVTVEGAGVRKGGAARLYVGNSGTTIRLLTGLCAGLGVCATLWGDDSIMRRPMGRVERPLAAMGAKITTNGGLPPVQVGGSELHGIDYVMETASAQVKSAVILAALGAEGVTRITERGVCRNHTELMLAGMGADIISQPLAEGGNLITVRRGGLFARDITVGGDISSAAFWLVLAAVIPDSRITIRNVNLNSTRTGILEVLRSAGVSVDARVVSRSGGEDCGDITAEYSGALKPFAIGGALVPYLIDEIPVLCVLACFIDGTSVISGAAELKVKESNRIDAMVHNLRLLGAEIEATGDGMIIHGRGGLCGGGQALKSLGDHRIAMSCAVAGLASGAGAVIDDMDCVAISYPDFCREIEGL